MRFRHGTVFARVTLVVGGGACVTLVFFGVGRGVTLVEGGGARATALLRVGRGGGSSSSLMSESKSDDDTSDIKSFFGLPGRRVSFSCSTAGCCGISCLYIVINSSQTGCDGTHRRYVFPFLLIDVNKLAASGVCAISKQFIPKKLPINPSFVPTGEQV